MRTIKTVFEQMNSWKGEKGEFKFIDGEFEDGLRFSYMAKPDNAAKVQEELRALIGKPGDFAGEEKTDNQGRVKFRLKDYPGKVKTGGFGGGAKAPYQIAWANTKEGQQFTTASIQAQQALKCAVELVAAGWIKAEPAPTPQSLVDATTFMANAFHLWLFKATPAPQEAKPPETPPDALGQTKDATIKSAHQAKSEQDLAGLFKALPDALKKDDGLITEFRKAKYHLREATMDKLIDELDFLGQMQALAKKIGVDLEKMRIKGDDPDACQKLIDALRTEQEQRAFAN